MTYRFSPFVARAQRLAVALLAVTIVISAPTAAAAASRPRDTAGDAQNRVEAAQRAANAEAGRYMSALSEFEGLRTQAAGVETAISEGEKRAGALRRIVQKRAARAYMRAGSSLPTVLTITDVGDLMRSDKLLATANVEDTDALSLLSSQQQDLRDQRENLRQLEAQQGAALADLQRASRKADALLSSALRARTDVQARLASQAAARRAAAPAARRTTRSTTPIVAVAPATPSTGSSGPSHGGDSFLACVRNRESRGNYGVVNPSGPYYGAYQFLASTWNITARHAGRMDLVGVVPSSASPADQDAIAWHLYQWQGSGPWGGSC